jgi:homoserine O-acetyltransferase/O-succinyltransferase
VSDVPIGDIPTGDIPIGAETPWPAPRVPRIRRQPTEFLPVTGAWRVGDPSGRRRFASVGDVPLVDGGALPGVIVAYETWGHLNADRSNAILVLHALTGDSHVTGPAGPGHPTPGWWIDCVGPGRALDTDRWFVVAPNVLGGCQGTTGPASFAPNGSPWGSRFPSLTVRDQVTAEVALTDALGIESWAAVIGGSMGGMRALEWAIGHPERLRSAVVIACGAAATAEQVGLSMAQVDVIVADPEFNGGDYYHRPTGGGPHRGLALARRMAHVSYRTEQELDARFDRDSVQSYLEHHGTALVRRFDAGSYVALSEAMNSHDVGRDRGGVDVALRSIRVPVAVAGITTDRLYPLRLQRQLVAAIPTAAPLVTIDSLKGHDGFLVETEAVGGFLSNAIHQYGGTRGDITTDQNKLLHSCCR